MFELPAALRNCGILLFLCLLLVTGSGCQADLAAAPTAPKAQTIPPTVRTHLTIQDTPLTAPQGTGGAVFFVAPDGLPSGDGSQANPWGLATAFNHPPQVQPGDVIWLRGGVYTGIYRSYLTGTAEAPITVRSYPGEWATIDTVAVLGDEIAFRVSGGHTIYWGFEIVNSRTGSKGGGVVVVENEGDNKLVNLIIHDMGASNYLRSGNEIYGSIMYNNGTDGGYGHQLYAANDNVMKPIRVVDSILFNGFGFGIHAYSEGVGLIEGMELIGNVWFNAGVAQTNGRRYDNLIIAAINNVQDILLQENMGWAHTPQSRSVALGRYWNNNIDITLVDNFLVGNTVFDANWQAIGMTGNTFLRLQNQNLIPQYPDNTYLTEAPDGLDIFVRSNQYEPGRAHVVVYNWDMLDAVDLDLGAILSQGDAYELRNAQDYFGAPVASGVYDGQPVTVPLAGLEPVQPIGPGLIEPSEYTGTQFNVFVLITTDHAGMSAALGPDVTGLGGLGHIVAHSVTLTNTGSVADTYELSIGDNRWSSQVSPVSVMLAPGESVPITVLVEVGGGAERDDAVLRATSRVDTGDTVTATISTIYSGYLLYLPLTSHQTLPSSGQSDLTPTCSDY